jgi:ketosteroid isomerase-like protein
MSRENVEIAVRGNEAFNRGDLDVAMQFFAPDAELRDLANAPDQPTAVRGIDAIRETWLLWAAELEELRADAEEWIDAGDVVIARMHWHGRGKASGVAIDQRQFDLYELRGGKIVRAALGFDTREEALAAAGHYA